MRVSRRLYASLIRELHGNLVSKQLSAAELTERYLAQLVAKEPALNSFITVADESAREQAQALDEHIARNGAEGLGLLAGIPVAIKDNICTAGVRTTAGSRCLESYTPTFDATAAARLKAAGAVLVGKTNMDEFGMGSTTENSAFKVTRNPWDSEHVPGGSSGGSAAAVAADQAVFALGSDTGGSIRQPAHFCGVVGVKPTYGRVSRYGLVSYASSLDVIGPMASSVEDAAIVMDAIAGHDVRDATSSQRSSPAFTANITPRDTLPSRPLAGKRIGLIAEASGKGIAANVRGAVAGAVAHLEALGAEVEEVSLPSFALGLPAYYVIALSEASSNLARYDGVRYGLQRAASGLTELYRGTRGEGLGGEVQRRILMGTYALSAGYYDAYYKRAQQVRTLIAREMGGALSRFDALLCPAAPTPAYRLGEKTTDPLAMYAGDLCTVPLNLSGLPAVTLPVAMVTEAGGASMPVGVQLIGAPFSEPALLGLGHVFELTNTEFTPLTRQA